LGSLLISYYNDDIIAKQELASLNLNYRKKFRATEAMFKGGGIAFELDNQLCIFPISTCATGTEGL
jgi:hypothetical protein